MVKEVYISGSKDLKGNYSLYVNGKKVSNSTSFKIRNSVVSGSVVMSSEYNGLRVKGGPGNGLIIKKISLRSGGEVISYPSRYRRGGPGNGLIIRGVVETNIIDKLMVDGEYVKVFELFDGDTKIYGEFKIIIEL